MSSKVPYGSTATVLVKAQPVGNRRQVINWVPLIVGYVVPWVTYIIVFYANSFDFHYGHPMLLFYLNIILVVTLLFYVR